MGTLLSDSEVRQAGTSATQGSSKAEVQWPDLTVTGTCHMNGHDFAMPVASVGRVSRKKCNLS